MEMRIVRLVIAGFIVSALVFGLSGCGTPTKWIGFPYSDGAGLRDEETGRLTWEWMGCNVRLHVDKKLVIVNGPYNPPDLPPNTAAEFVRLLPGIHTVRYYVYRQGFREPVELEVPFEVEAGHRYKIRNGKCSRFSTRGTAWIEDLGTKQIVAKTANCI